VTVAPLARAALAILAAAAAAGTGWVVFGSAATVTVTPKNHSAFRVCVLTAYPTTSTVEIDSWVDENSKSTTHGSATTLSISSLLSKNTRAFVRFDLSKCTPAIAASATVAQATMRLFLNLNPTSSRTYNVNRVTTPCPENATTCWSESGLTWNNQPSVVATPTATLALSGSSAKTYYSLDLTTDVAGMVAGTVPNDGWRIADANEGSSLVSKITFEAKNTTSNPDGAPQLTVVYRP